MRRLHVITPLLLGLAMAAPAPAAHAQIGIGLSITIAPPVLPIYVQPPAVGLLWTPGYWGWNNGVYAWNGGYWGPHIGFYGGVNYGFGYIGVGYVGGYWNNGVFAYNRGYNNFGGVHITNVYNRTVINNNTSRVAFNGGAGGLSTRPTAQEEAYSHEQHVAPTSLQTEHEHTAAANPTLRASANGGRPPIAATSRPGEFTGRGVVGTRPAVTPAAAGAHGSVPAVHGPTTPVGAHPGTVTPPHGGPAGAPHTGGPAITRPVTPAAHAPAPRPAVAPHPAAAPHPAPAPHGAPSKEEHKP